MAACPDSDRPANVLAAVKDEPFGWPQERPTFAHLVTNGAGAATGYLPTGLLPTGHLPKGYLPTGAAAG
jgi:hypothetical protein